MTSTALEVFAFGYALEEVPKIGRRYRYTLEFCERAFDVVRPGTSGRGGLADAWFHASRLIN
jgi:hypothetical protein